MPLQPNDQCNQDRIAVDFIDPLFAVVLSISLAQIGDQKWFLHPIIFRAPYLFQVGTLIWVYCVVITSWIGYHQSISGNPIGVTTRPGRIRFFLDVLLLIAYFVFLVRFEVFIDELWTVVTIYVLFVVWDYCKVFEHPALSPGDRTKSNERRGVTVLYLILFAILATLYQVPGIICRTGAGSWIVLAAAIALTFAYRAHKRWLRPGNFLAALAPRWFVPYRPNEESTLTGA